MSVTRPVTTISRPFEARSRSAPCRGRRWRRGPWSRMSVSGRPAIHVAQRRGRGPISVVETREDVVSGHQARPSDLACEAMLARDCRVPLRRSRRGFTPPALDVTRIRRDTRWKDPFNQGNKVPGVSRVGIARFLLLHDGHGHLGEVIHHAGNRSGRLRPDGPGPRASLPRSPGRLPPARWSWSWSEGAPDLGEADLPSPGSVSHRHYDNSQRSEARSELNGRLAG